MKVRSLTTLTKVRELLNERKYEAAQKALRTVNVDGLTGVELGQYYLAMGELATFQGNYSHAFLEKALSMFKDSDANWCFAQAKFVRGCQLQATGKPLDAKESLIESYTAFLRIDDYGFAARALNRLARLSLLSGDVGQAIDSLAKSIDYYDKAGESRQSVACKVNLALVNFLSGAISRALDLYFDMGRLRYTFNTRRRVVYSTGRALATAFSGDIPSARKIIKKVPPLLKGFDHEAAWYNEYLGWICILDGDYTGAEKALNKGLEISLKIAPESALISQIKRLMGDTYLATGRYEEAAKSASEALAVAEKINERAEIAACYRIFAQLDTVEGRKKQAREWYCKAIELFVMITSRYELAVTRFLAASSGLYDNGERVAMLYLAKEYFDSENLTHWSEKIQKELNRPGDDAPVKIETSQPSLDSCPTIIAVSPQMKKILSLGEHVARSDMSVLLTGQTGTGKDLLARFIHCHSGRKGEFVTVNAAAIPTSMVESELFGYARGAFTGAGKDKAGLFEMADGGTFYLNEVADATPEFQAKLLEVLENKQIRRLGENKVRQVAFRLVAATNHDLNQKMRDGYFRCDLYHRLNEIPINLPPLDQRDNDIPALVAYFLKNLGYDFTRAGDPEKLERLTMILSRQKWPGNVRELMAQVRYLYLAGNGDPETMIDLALGDGTRSDSEKLANLLNITDWNRSIVATILGVSEGTVRNRIKKFGLASGDS